VEQYENSRAVNVIRIFAVHLLSKMRLHAVLLFTILIISAIAPITPTDLGDFAIFWLKTNFS
jgi:hypothetical protein